MRRRIDVCGYVALACLVGVACNGEFTTTDVSRGSSGSPGAVMPPGGSSGSGGGSGSSGSSGGTASSGGGLPPGAGTVPDDASAGSDADPPATAFDGDGGAPCETVMDSYGYARCICTPGASVPVEAGVASCMNYDCCVSYGGDSGVALGFANPATTSGLCACFTSADIAAVSGVSTTCNDFVNHGGGGGVSKVVPSCP
jgi:hypothetical protein